MEYINSTETVRLSRLILSGELNDSSMIQIFNANGNFICQGHWYDDSILKHRGILGKAYKSETGHIVKFKQIH